MLNRIVTTILLGTAFLSTSYAQITTIGSVPASLLVVRSLPNAGVKLYSDTPSGLVLYNLDLTTYLSITYPALPVGWSYSSVLYFTENTFDLDASSIEVVLLTVDQAYNRGTRVIRDDGTVLFDEFALAPSGTSGYSELNSKPTLFTGEDGFTYMLLCNYPSGTPTESKLYRLPGELPCLDCAGATSGIAPVPEGTSGTELAVSPNPTTGRVTVSYKLPSGIHFATLIIHNTSGQVVDQTSVDDSGRASISLAGHARGTYMFSLMAGHQVLRSLPLVLSEQ